MQQRRRIATSGQTSVNPTLAVILTLALIASAAFGGNRILQTQDGGGSPIEVATATESFASGDNVLIDDAAIASQSGVPGPRTVKEFSRDEEFSLFALTWINDNDVAAYVRAEMPDGSWGPWWSAEPIGDMGPNGENGTELIYVEPTNKVQVSITGVDILGTPEAAPDGAAAPAEAEVTVADAAAVDTPAEAPVSAGLAPLPTNYGDIAPVADVVNPSDLDVVFMDGRADEGGIALATDSVTDGMPTVVTRAGWGADESMRCRTATYDSRTQAAAVHHTAGSNNYTRAQAAGIVRGIYTYHASNLGWCDVGYNALVDKYGTIYEGRYGGLDKNVQGAHVGGFNHNTFGISMMGNYDVTQTTPAMVRSVGDMIGWKAAVAGFDPLGSATYTPYSFSGSRYAGGVPLNLPNIFAHRDAHNNACPGQYGYAQMGTIRTYAKDRYDEIRSGSTTTRPGTTTTPSTSTPVDGTPPVSTPPSTQPEPVAPAPRDPDITDTLGSAARGDGTALLTIVGSLAAVAIAVIAANNTIPGTTQQVGDVKVMEGVTLADLRPVLDIVSTFAGDTRITQAVNRVGANYGAVLGDPRGGVSTDDAKVALFDNGVVIDQPGSSEARALWGIIGDVWAGQGFDLGPLGMPLNEQYNDGDRLRVDFEGGTITVNPFDGSVDVSLD